MSTQQTQTPKPFWYQRLFIGVTFVCIGFLALGGFFGAIRYALELVNPITTYIGTVFVVVLGISIHLWLRGHPLPWVIQGQEIRIKRLGLGPVLGFAGACLLLWVPRLISDSKTDIFRELALRNVRKNIVSIHLRLRELYNTVEKVGTESAAEQFRSLPDRLTRMGSLDMSFCRSLESHVTDLNHDFLRAATAYCGSISSFSEAESNAWDLAFKQNKSGQDLLGAADEFEAQLALACTLAVPEKSFYILKFRMILYSAKRMGLSEHDLLVGLQELGFPDIPIPTPFIEEHVRDRFHVDCATGKILR